MGVHSRDTSIDLRLLRRPSSQGHRGPDPERWPGRGRFKLPNSGAKRHFGRLHEAMPWRQTDSRASWPDRVASGRIRLSAPGRDKVPSQSGQALLRASLPRSRKTGHAFEIGCPERTCGWISIIETGSPQDQRRLLRPTRSGPQAGRGRRRPRGGTAPPDACPPPLSAVERAPSRIEFRHQLSADRGQNHGHTGLSAGIAARLT